LEKGSRDYQPPTRNKSKREGKSAEDKGRGKKKKKNQETPLGVRNALEKERVTTGGEEGVQGHDNGKKAENLSGTASLIKTAAKKRKAFYLSKQKKRKINRGNRKGPKTDSYRA